MDVFKKTFLTIIIILLVISLFKDLTVGTVIQQVEKNHEVKKEEDQLEDEFQETSENKQDDKKEKNQIETKRYLSKNRTVKSGETVLSIVESLNQQQTSVIMEQIILDFEKLNPGINAHQIEPNKTYLFPVYKNLE